jgi:nicotinate (nicotinamide) nucleotide adenylyltransferase
MARIGIYSGVFDPVHAGHIAFALQAVDKARLDKMYFLPERRPAHKQGVEHFAHRVAMLKRAAKPHPKFDVLELPDISFTVKRTLPQLEKIFLGDELVFLFGSDAVKGLPFWPAAERLLMDSELVVGLRNQDELQATKKQIQAWPFWPKAVTIIKSYAPDISSGRVREALYQRRTVKGLLSSVRNYSNRHWLYVSFNN